MKLKKIEITICEACLNGEGSECHTPGCALWLHNVDLPIHPEVYEVIEEWEEDQVAEDEKEQSMKRAGPGRIRLTIFVCNPCRYVNSSSVKRVDGKLDIHSCDHEECKGRSLTASKSKIIDTPDWCPYLKR